MSLKNSVWLSHISAIVFIIIFECVSYRSAFGKSLNYATYLMHWPAKLVIFYGYTQRLFALPSDWPTSKKMFLWVLYTTLSLIIYVGLNYLAIAMCEVLKLDGSSPNDPKINVFAGTLIRGILVLFAAHTYYFFKGYRFEKKEGLASRDRAELAEIKSLKAEENPHFQLTIVNILHKVSMQRPMETARAIYLYGRLLRYQLDDMFAQEQFVSLEQDLSHVACLIELQRLQSKKTYITVEHPDCITGVVIMPRLVLNLAENMVKHGNLSSANQPGIISIIIEGGSLCICTCNLINPVHNKDGYGSGMERMRRKLMHTYGNHARLTFCLNGRYFQVRVVITTV